jgi:tetratricopeptide (TPR) repeat protein
MRLHFFYFIRMLTSARRFVLARLTLVQRMLALVFCLIVSFTLPLRAQRPPGVDDRFREASEAMRNGNLEAAAEGFAAVVKEAPSFAEAHLNLGLVREEQGRHEDAIASFQKALLLNPKLHGANLFLGIAEYRLNRLNDAVPILRKETAAYPKDATAWMWLGVVELAREHPEDAADALDRAAKLAPDSVDILYHRGQAHLLVSKNSYEKMFKEDPRSWRVHQVLAQTSSESEHYDDAIVQYLAAIKLAPTQPGLHEELGSAYRDALKMDEAEAAFLRELEIDPHNALARYKLGVLYMEKGDGAKAKDLIEAALREKPGLLHSDYNLGRAERLVGDDAAAAAHLERAVAGDSDPEIVQQAWYQLGMVYRRLHRLDEAQKAMAMFQKLKDAEAEESRQSLSRYKNKQSSEPSEPPPVPQNP